MFRTFKYSYQLKRQIKFGLFVLALVIGGFTVYYTSSLANKLKAEEVKKMELWAEASKAIADPEVDIENLSFYDKIISGNTTIPVILAYDNGNIESRNLDSAVVSDSAKLQKVYNKMKSNYDPIVIDIGDGIKQYLYYDDSILLQKLKYYPYFQLGIVSIFLLIAYLAFNYAKRSEENKVWVGLAKETAHQLGTPMSSLLAWIDLIEQDPNQANEMAFGEMRKDMGRLHTITERFSKIGSDPILKEQNIAELLEEAVKYMKLRVSESIQIELLIGSSPVMVKVNKPLFEWVVENLIKNAIDAIPNGKGQIQVVLHADTKKITIDFKDSGIGIPSSKFKTVFKPGFTTKKRGWGLGLSLVKRIIEHYHKGLVFVKESSLNNGTTFRIILPIKK